MNRHAVEAIRPPSEVGATTAPAATPPGPRGDPGPALLSGPAGLAGVTEPPSPGTQRFRAPFRPRGRPLPPQQRSLLQGAHGGPSTGLLTPVCRLPFSTVVPQTAEHGGLALVPGAREKGL